MTAYPTYTATDLAGFTGRVVGAYPEPYTDNSAIPQATLLFRISTGLGDWPDDADKAQIAKFAVLSMADAFVLSQPFQAQQFNPFQSETIGSYSYTKALKLLQAGQPTGVLWFDLAVQRLGVSQDVARVISDGRKLFDTELETVTDWSGARRILGPAEIQPVDVPFSISRNIPFDPNVGQSSRGVRG